MQNQEDIEYEKQISELFRGREKHKRADETFEIVLCIVEMWSDLLGVHNLKRRLRGRTHMAGWHTTTTT